MKRKESTKIRVCDYVYPDGHICGHKCRPRGIGSHKRLEHGIIETVVVFDSSTQVKNESKNGGGGKLKNRKTPHLSTQVESADFQKSNSSGQFKVTQVKRHENDLSDLSEIHSSTQVKNDLSTQVKRPSDFVKKREVVSSKIKTNVLESTYEYKKQWNRAEIVAKVQYVIDIIRSGNTDLIKFRDFGGAAQIVRLAIAGWLRKNYRLPGKKYIHDYNEFEHYCFSHGLYINDHPVSLPWKCNTEQEDYEHEIYEMFKDDLVK
jgi:hypothetical protein